MARLLRNTIWKAGRASEADKEPRGLTPGSKWLNEESHSDRDQKQPERTGRPGALKPWLTFAFRGMAQELSFPMVVSRGLYAFPTLVKYWIFSLFSFVKE